MQRRGRRRPRARRVAQHLAGSDLVLHTAVVSMVAPMREAWEVNCGGPALLTACREQGVARFVHLSSVAAFGFDFPDKVDECIR